MKNAECRISFKENSAMEKITKEELLEELGVQTLNDEELEKITGGSKDNEYENCSSSAINRAPCYKLT